MTKEYQEAERRLREQTEPVGDADFRAEITHLEEALEAIKEGRVLVMDDIGQTFAEALQELAKNALEKHQV